DSPRSTWMDQAGPSEAARQTVLTMTSDVLPVLGEGQETKEQVLIEIATGEPLDPDDTVNWRFVGEHWGKRLCEELRVRRAAKTRHGAQLKHARALALGVLANRLPFNILTFKQFRDADHPESACYQAVVQVRRVIERIYDIQEIEQPLHVRIHRY